MTKYVNAPRKMIDFNAKLGTILIKLVGETHVFVMYSK
jgi:hypothetical protein